MAGVGGSGDGVDSTAPENTRQCRKHDECYDGEEILDDQPTDRDSSIRRAKNSTSLQRLQQDDGARDGQAEAEYDTRAPRPSPQMRNHRAKNRRNRNLDDGSRHGDPADGQEVGDREMQSNAEHQQDHTELRELRRKSGIRDVPRSERPD